MPAMNEVWAAALTDKTMLLGGTTALVEVNASVPGGEKISVPGVLPPPLPITTRRTGTVVGLLAAPVWVNVMEPLYTPAANPVWSTRSEEHTSELQSLRHLV